MSRAVVFAGPTLDAASVRAILDAEVRGPAARGDVLRAVESGATAIGVVDGYFERVAAVWHKEILWALTKGCRVYGAASMGALRAAELAAFGMVPVGEIAAAYLRGDITDDDEVAVAHASEEDGYRRTSEAMVDIRATLASAVTARVIDEETRALLARSAKALFYPERVYPAVLAHAEANGADPAQLAAFCAFLPRGRIDQKRLDALALMERLRAMRDAPPPPKVVRYFFSHTDAWEAIRRRVDG